jgi:hypothetical protein
VRVARGLLGLGAATTPSHSNEEEIMTKKKLKQVTAADLAKISGGIVIALTTEMEDGGAETPSGKSGSGGKSRGVSIQ